MPIKVLVTTDAVVSELQRRAKAPTSAYRDRFRAEIILLRLSGLKVAEVAARVGDIRANRITVVEPFWQVWHCRVER